MPHAPRGEKAALKRVSRVVRRGLCPPAGKPGWGGGLGAREASPGPSLVVGDGLEPTMHNPRRTTHRPLPAPGLTPYHRSESHPSVTRDLPRAATGRPASGHTHPGTGAPMTPERWPARALALALAVLSATIAVPAAEALRIVNYNVTNYPGVLLAQR